MSDALKKVYAKRAYKTLCDALDAREWNYNKKEEDLQVEFGVNGDDLPMNFIIFVDEGRQILRLLSPLGFTIPDDKRVELGAAVCAANFGMADGGFDFDLAEGRIVYRQGVCFHECMLSEAAVQYLISCACAMVDKYNEKFLAVSKGFLNLTDFINSK